MTLDNKEKEIGSILALVIKENYKGVNEVDNDTGYIEEEIAKIFEKVKLANMDLKDEDRYNSCFITNLSKVFPYSHLVKGNMTTLEIYTVIINLAIHCIIRDTATNIISLSSILSLKELYSIVSILYKSTNIRIVCKKNHTSKYLFVNRIYFSNSNDEYEDVNTRLKKSNEHDLLNFDAITVLDSNGIKNGGILDTITNVNSNMMEWPNINLYQNLLPFLNALKESIEEEQDNVITFFNISGRTLSNFVNAKKEGAKGWHGYPDEMIYGGYIPLEQMEHDLAIGAAFSQEILKIKLGRKQQVKEGTVDANEMTSILSCNPPNSLAYSFNNPPKYSTIIFSPDYKISEILEVKDIEKQVEATHMENKNTICIYNDKKEKRNSYEAILNVDVVNDGSISSGHGRLEFSIFGYGADKEEAISELNIIYVNIMNKFHEIHK